MRARSRHLRPRRPHIRGHIIEFCRGQGIDAIIPPKNKGLGPSEAKRLKILTSRRHGRHGNPGFRLIAIHSRHPQFDRGQRLIPIVASNGQPAPFFLQPFDAEAHHLVGFPEFNQVDTTVDIERHLGKQPHRAEEQDGQNESHADKVCLLRPKCNPTRLRRTASPHGRSAEQDPQRRGRADRPRADWASRGTGDGRPRCGERCRRRRATAPQCRCGR